jgi:hypothetical protein
VLVNGEEVTTRRDGTFTHALHPSGDGPFEVVVEVDDPAHRSEKVTRTVAIDRSPPRLEMTSPRTATTTARSHIVELSGRVTDPHLEGLYLDGKPIVVAEDGAFCWPVFAPPGAGASVSLEAADTLGNRTSRSYHVIGRANRASRGVMTFHDTWSDAQAAAQRSQRLVFACVSRYNPP